MQFTKGLGRAAKAICLLFHREKSHALEVKDKYTVPRRIPKLTILVIADLHSCFRESMERLNIAAESESYDCVLFLGDIKASDIRMIIPHTGGKPCFFVLGNHDEWHQNDNIDGIADIDGRTAVVNNVRISGVSGAPRYKDGDWVMRTEEELGKAIEKIGETDILVSHESPHYLMSKNFAHCGYTAITDFLEKGDVPLHIFGHHHKDFEKVVGKTLEVCVYGCSVITTEPFAVKKISI